MHIIRGTSKTFCGPTSSASALRNRPVSTYAKSNIQHVHASPCHQVGYPSREVASSTSCGANPKAAHSTREIMTYSSTATPRLCTPCPYPTTYVPDVNQFNQDQYTELVLHFQGQIKDLWKKVWFGLYQAHNDSEAGKTLSHASQIRILYAGAGMADLLGKASYEDRNSLVGGKWEFIGLGNLSQALFEFHPRGSSSLQAGPVLGRLRIYDGLALDNLQHIVTLLKEYERQAEAVSELYAFLQQHQIDNVDQKTKRKSSAAHRGMVLRGFRNRTGSIATTLLDLDRQMVDLQRDMDQEAREIYGCLDGIECMHIKKEIIGF